MRCSRECLVGKGANCGITARVHTLSSVSLRVVRVAVADGILKKRRQRLRAALFSSVYAVGVGFHSFRFSSVSSFHIADSSCE